jgi:hypothetical protein
VSEEQATLNLRVAPDGDRQGADELRIFRAFVESAGLVVPSESIQKRQPPDPDIQCELDEFGSTCFELVEIVDRKLARAVGNQLAVAPRISDAAESLGLSGFSDALISVRFVDTAGSAKRNSAIPLMIAWLQQLRPGFQGRVIIENDPKLRAAVQSVRIARGNFAGPCFQIDGATFVFDPVIEEIRGKFTKRYETGNRLELLAYYELHPTQRAELRLPEIEEFVRNNLQCSPFSRIWIFDAGNRAILLSSE